MAEEIKEIIEDAREEEVNDSEATREAVEDAADHREAEFDDIRGRIESLAEKLDRIERKLTAYTNASEVVREAVEEIAEEIAEPDEIVPISELKLI